MIIPVYKPYIAQNTKNYVMECIDSGWISSRGEFIKRFEEKFADYIGVEDAVTVSNGTVALHLALVALGIKTGDEVIVPSFTYIATINALLYVGAIPVYVDSLETSLQVNADLIRRAITPRTKAVIAVHLYGDCCDMDELTSLCAEHSLLLIEDAAEGFGTLWKGRHVGTFGDISTFSFFGNKTITTGEGGMVVCKRLDISKFCRHLKSQAVSKDREYWHDAVGYNYRMTNIQAAIGLAQIEEAETILKYKREIAQKYSENLQRLPLRFHEKTAEVDHSFWMCSIILDDRSKREPLRKKLSEMGVETRPFFPPAHKMPHCFQDISLPVAESISERGINLPSFPMLSDNEINYVCQGIRSFFV